MDLACPTDARPGDPPSDEAGYGAMLRELAEIGMRVARRLDQVTQAVADGDPEAATHAALLLGGKDVGTVLGQVSRGVRLTLMLALRHDDRMSRKAKDTADQRAAEAAQARAAQDEADEDARQDAEAAVRKIEVYRIATDAIETAARERGDRFDREAKLAELKEMLEGEYADIGEYCLTAGVKEVCQALDVIADPNLWEDDMPRHDFMARWLAKSRARSAGYDDDWPP